LHFLVVLVRMVGWMLDVLVVVRLLVVVVVCVRDDPLVWTSYPWWPLFLDNLLLGACSPRHETDNRICAAVASVLGLSLWCHYRGLGGYS
jgi:hypothetical protein